ncbi:hypothetical protein, partial [Janthinobacterium sp. PSPC3-1]|uniref:hypothetical protein n=1 Tax=Janthinobacterium sp. PSPC3-1 TaxID=2804653 RepID=UPI003CF9D962
MAELAARQRAHALEVDGELAAAPQEADAVDGLVRGSGGVGGAQNGHPRAAPDQAGGHLLEVALSAPALGVVGV